ncbi:PREDICTED: glycine receptor subunit alpha-4-like [Branchiostoma belcheri]|uniref:Glycine receptor subunit alpha-4-like n=1 Tax=Branchiostoma belcheri TaxID=7741 RepID=A0A6P4ZS66_BRABE|nr:PREDICTED: glycine receptor subunit alpha-4-like [Branchiostoma belcheri]
MAPVSVLYVAPGLLFVALLVLAGSAESDDGGPEGGEEEDDDHSHDVLHEVPGGEEMHHKPETGERWMDVTLAAHLLSFGAVSEVTMDFKASVQLSMEWRDPRLANLTDQSWVPVDPEVEIWAPHVDFRNTKAIKMTTGEEETTTWVSRDGLVNRVQRFDLTAACAMNLQSFPLDRQLCKIKLDGYEDARLRWGFPSLWSQTSAPVITDATALHSQFKMTGLSVKAYANSFLPNIAGKGCVYHRNTCDYQDADRCLTNQQRCEDAVGSPECDRCIYYSGFCTNDTDQCNVISETSNKNIFTSAEIQLHLSRRLAYHLLQMYIPSTSIVIMSWVSFWIDAGAVPARVCLGVTTVLTMTAQSSRAAGMAEVSYVRALDVWIVVCQLFVFSALIEYAVVNFVFRFGAIFARRRSSTANGKESCSKSEDVASLKILEPKTKPEGTTGKDKAQIIDNCCRVAFPLTFVIFNAAYWSLYQLL